MNNQNTLEKPHNDYNWMHQAYVVDKKTPKEISKELNISVKLVDLKIRQHGLFV